MRILFIAPGIQDMYKDIEAEMVRQGHEVVVIRDQSLRADPYKVSCPLLVPVKKIVWSKLSQKHWDNIIASDDRIRQPFDLVFIISGVSVNKQILNYLKGKNPNIRSVFYTWDACNYYRFDRFLSLVDKCYTFELEDAYNDKRWIFLPIYCKEQKQEEDQEYKYDLFTIGSSHSGRYSFLKKILPQLKENDIRYYIKVVTQPLSLSLRDKIRFIFLGKKKKAQILEELRFSNGLENKEILSNAKILHNEYQKISDSSRCVLDDQREGQSGLTARFMWALAAGKKIITTNKWAYQYSFVSKEQVAVLDKNNPIMPLDFLRTPLGLKSDVREFYIDKWVTTILCV